MVILTPALSKSINLNKDFILCMYHLDHLDHLYDNGNLSLALGSFGIHSFIYTLQVCAVIIQLKNTYI